MTEKLEAAILEALAASRADDYDVAVRKLAAAFARAAALRAKLQPAPAQVPWGTRLRARR